MGNYKGREHNPLAAVESLQRHGGKTHLELHPDGGDQRVVEISRPIGIKTWGVIDYLRRDTKIAVVIKGV